jgi:XisH protein
VVDAGVVREIMPRKDVYHGTVVEALIADGWTITADPLLLTYGGKDVYVDVGAEDAIGAERAGLKIGVEVKSFVGASDVHELEIALGQYNLYRDILSEVEPDRLLYLAIPRRTHGGIFADPLGQLIVRKQQLRLIVFDEVDARIIQWVP